MPRVIRWFNKDDEWEAGTKELPDIPLSELQRAFPASAEESKDPLMYCCHEIKEDHVSFFQQHMSFEFEFDKYDYFLEYDADGN